MNMVEKIRSICCLIVTLLKLSVGNNGHGPESMEDVEDDLQLNLPVELHEGLVVTVIKRPDKCIRQASRGDILTVHYTGRFNDQHGEVFDTSLKEGWPPYKFQLGAGRVIQGYERGAPGMCRGETRTFQVPPSLAYGERGVPGKIPGNSTLHFTVECLSIADGELEAPSPPTPPREKVTTTTVATEFGSKMFRHFLGLHSLLSPPTHVLSFSPCSQDSVEWSNVSVG